MNRLVCVAGLLASALLLTTCAGTYRAITDDYASDAPVVESLRPLHGVSGEQVQFEATLCLMSGGRANEFGEYEGLYIWDFGGGAEPNISHEAKPIVTLRDGLRSPYDCSLTLKANCTGDDTEAVYTFILTVVPLEVAAVTPLSGVGDGTATFSALIRSGVATNYHWDFGGACSPSGSNEANPTVTFINQTQTYPARLIVSNDFEAYEFNFVIQVVAKPEEEEATQ